MANDIIGLTCPPEEAANANMLKVIRIPFVIAIGKATGSKSGGVSSAGRRPNELNTEQLLIATRNIIARNSIKTDLHKYAVLSLFSPANTKDNNKASQLSMNTGTMTHTQLCALDVPRNLIRAGAFANSCVSLISSLLGL